MASSSDDPYNDFDLFDSYLNDWSSFGAPTDNGVGSTESPFSTPYGASSRGSSSVPRSIRSEDISTWSGNQSQTQLHQLHSDDGDRSQITGRISRNIGSSNHSLFNYDMLGDEFFINDDDQDSSTRLHYTFNQVTPACSHQTSEPFGLQDLTSGFEAVASDESSNGLLLNVDPPFIPVPQTSVYSFPQEIVPRTEAFTSLLEEQSVPRNMAILTGRPPEDNNLINTPIISVEEINRHCPAALDAWLEFIEEPFVNTEPCSLESTANNDVRSTVNNTQRIMNPVAASRCEYTPLNTIHTISNHQSGHKFSEKSRSPSGSYTAKSLIQSGRRKFPPILQAPLKSSNIPPKTLKSPAHAQDVYGPKEALPRRNYRRKLTDKGKKNAMEVRKNGPCVVCLTKKQMCDPIGICKSCQIMALAKAPVLAANHICIRGGILVFRQGIPDFYDMSRRLGRSPRTFCGPERTIIIGSRGTTTNNTTRVLFPTKVPLTVRVQEYVNCVAEPNMLWSDGSMKLAVASYAIHPSSLPTASDLDRWGRNLHFQSSNLPGFQSNIMDNFLYTYQSTKPSLKYHHLVDLTIRLVNLSTWLFDPHPITSLDNLNNKGLLLFNIDDDRVERRLSEAARSQLLLIAAEAFEATEKQILKIVDSSMKPSGGNPQDALILGLCLRRISLLYRTSFKRFQKSALDARIVRKREKPKAMYEALITAYSLVYRGAKNPYSKHWMEDDYLVSLGNNQGLFNLFLEVKEFDMQYFKDHIDDEDDAHLKKLFLERKEGGVARK